MVYIIASFEHSIYVELAITALIKNGVPKEKILAVPLDKNKEARTILDTIYKSDGVSMVDGALILGTIFMVLGTIYGFVLEWGPILWALIGLLFGAVLGLVLDTLINKRRGNNAKVNGESTEVVIMINCKKVQESLVEDTLWDCFPLGVGKFSKVIPIAFK